jgi:hypothetical protein
MGGGSSKIKADDYILRQSRADLLKITSNPRAFSDSIFLYLKNELRLGSYLSLLGSQTACNQFVFVLASDLLKVFERIPVTVGEGKKGALLFTPLSELQTGVGKEYTQRYCQYVAKFITRLFQIYSALAMSVLDNEAIYDMASDYGISSGALPTGQRGFRTGLEQGEGRGQGQGQQGGDIKALQLQDPAVTLTNQIMDTLIESRDNKINYKGVDYYKLRGYDIYGSQTTTSNNYNIYFEKSNISYVLTILFRVTEQDIYNPKYKLEIPRLKGDGYQVPLGKVLMYTVTWGNIMNDIAAILNKLNDTYKSKVYEMKKGIRRAPGASGAPGAPGAAVGFKADSIYALLEGRHEGKLIPRPTPHCVTRALQLISIQPSTGPRTAVCKKKFLDLTAGEATHGLQTLVKLFFDVTREKVGGPIESARGEYAKLLLSFPNGKTKALAGCGKDEIMRVRPGSEKNAAAKIKEMFLYQAKHTARVSSLFQALFTVKKIGDSYKIEGIHPNVYNGGIEYLEGQMMPVVRQLLVEYYSQCETLYDQARHDIMTV